MKLPNGDRAIVDDAKLVNYCLSTTHPRGRHKARLFEAAFGFTSHNAMVLRSLLLEAARSEDTAVATKQSFFGQLYELRFRCRGPIATGDLLSVWIVLNSEKFPRLVTCYPV